MSARQVAQATNVRHGATRRRGSGCRESKPSGRQTEPSAPDWFHFQARAPKHLVPGCRYSLFRRTRKLPLSMLNVLDCEGAGHRSFVQRVAYSLFPGSIFRSVRFPMAGNRPASPRLPYGVLPVKIGIPKRASIIATHQSGVTHAAYCFRPRARWIGTIPQPVVAPGATANNAGGPLVCQIPLPIQVVDILPTATRPANTRRSTRVCC